MFKSFFLVILIMVESALEIMRKGIKKGVFEAVYRCSLYFDEYSIFFPRDFVRFIFTIGRNYASVEEQSIIRGNEFLESLGIPIDIIFKITYRPPPDEFGKFEKDIYRKYCDDLKSRFRGSFSEYCTAGVNSEYCPILGSIVYRLYFHLVNDYIYPFLSHLLKAEFHVESCTPFMLRTRDITLLPTLLPPGVFSYRDRFSFSSKIVRLDVDCDHPSESIRGAIRTIMKLL